MQYYMTGEIELDRRLACTEVTQVQSIFYDSYKVYTNKNKVHLEEVCTTSIDDCVCAFNAWCFDHGITIRDGSWISYDGDDEGRIEWNDDEWNDYSRDECAVRDATDESLMHELIHRGYFAITNARLIEILVGYVENDLESADTDYVREVLYDTCGCTDEELNAVGLNYLISEKE